jgi:hypothetical protein
LEKTAGSLAANQSNERNASIVDAHGRLAAVAIGTPHLTFVSQLPVRYATPYEAICHAWAEEPDRFRLDPVHLTSGLNT